MLILAFDTTSNSISIALSKDKKMLSKKSIIGGFNQSELLLSEIEEILKQHNIWYQNLNLISATKGPGSFTGCRIGLTVAKTIKLATNLPLILLNSCEVIAYKYQKELSKKSAKILVTLDARANEIFYCEYNFNENLAIGEKEPNIMSLDEILKIIPKEKFLLCGSATKIIDEILQKKSINNYEIAPEFKAIEAQYIANLAYEKFQNNFESTNLDPIYLREPNITKRKSP